MVALYSEESILTNVLLCYNRFIFENSASNLHSQRIGPMLEVVTSLG